MSLVFEEGVPGAWTPRAVSCCSPGSLGGWFNKPSKRKFRTCSNYCPWTHCFEWSDWKLGRLGSDKNWMSKRMQKAKSKFKFKWFLLDNFRYISDTSCKILPRWFGSFSGGDQGSLDSSGHASLRRIGWSSCWLHLAGVDGWISQNMLLYRFGHVWTSRLFWRLFRFFSLTFFPLGWKSIKPINIHKPFMADEASLWHASPLWIGPWTQVIKPKVSTELLGMISSKSMQNWWICAGHVFQQLKPLETSLRKGGFEMFGSWSRVAGLNTGLHPGLWTKNKAMAITSALIYCIIYESIWEKTILAHHTVFVCTSRTCLDVVRYNQWLPDSSDDTATQIACFHGCSSRKMCGFDAALYHSAALNWNHMGQTEPPTCKGPFIDMAQERHHLGWSHQVLFVFLRFWPCISCTMLHPSHVLGSPRGCPLLRAQLVTVGKPKDGCMLQSAPKYGHEVKQSQQKIMRNKWEI